MDRLGEERTRLFVELVNDWMDILLGIQQAYPKEELETSLVFHDFTSLAKEINWCQLLLFAGNYPLLSRNLRFLWELLFRAYYADMYAAAHPHDPDPPGPHAGEKIDWLAEREENGLNWNTALQPTLEAVLPTAEHAAIDDH